MILISRSITRTTFKPEGIHRYSTVILHVWIGTFEMIVTNERRIDEKMSLAQMVLEED